jgi:hypothetical protein
MKRCLLPTTSTRPRPPQQERTAACLGAAHAKARFSQERRKEISYSGAPAAKAGIPGPCFESTHPRTSFLWWEVVQMHKRQILQAELEGDWRLLRQLSDATKLGRPARPPSHFMI